MRKQGFTATVFFVCVCVCVFLWGYPPTNQHGTVRRWGGGGAGLDDVPFKGKGARTLGSMRKGWEAIAILDS